MAPTTMIEHGDARTFRIAFRASQDPDARYWADPALPASWGEIEIWAGGVDVTANLFRNRLRTATAWYVLPLLEWIAANWEPLVHEERTPEPMPGGHDVLTAWLLGRLTAGLGEESWSTWSRWWQRHDLSAGREGGILPPLVIRRWRGTVEFSWFTGGAAALPPGVMLTAGRGTCRVPLPEAVGTLWSFLKAVTEYLLSRAATSPRVQELARTVERIESVPRHAPERLSWLTDGVWFKDRVRDPSELLGIAERRAAKPAAFLKSLFEPLQLVGGPAEPSFLAADLLRTLDRNAAEDDFWALARRTEPGRGPEALVNAFDIERAGAGSWHDVPAWLSGYEIAQRVSVALEDRDATSDARFDLTRLTSELGVAVESLALKSVARSASLIGPHIRPTIYLNAAVGQLRQSGPRRFAIAHELCHLLCDRDEHGCLAMASGDWVPGDVEARANAFAAYLLMPPAAVRRSWYGAEREELPRALRELALRFDVSLTAAAFHLCNLGLISESQRDDALESLGYATTGSRPTP